jgi:membrane protein YdbS with pleckstrin-like domain
MSPSAIEMGTWAWEETASDIMPSAAQAAILIFFILLFLFLCIIFLRFARRWESAPGRLSDELVSVRDFVATFCGVLGELAQTVV